MDTISRDNNSGGLLPWAGAILGGIGLLLGGIALAKTSALGTKVDDNNAAINTRVGDVETKAQSAYKAAQDVSNYTKENIAPWITQAGQVITALQDDVRVLKTKPVASTPNATSNGNKGPVTAGKDEYVVKAGDIGSSIARATGFSIKDIEAVNPGLDWTKLRPNQKLKLPAKK
jgi:LysM repeat protein